MTVTTPEQLERLLNRIEDCNLEFKAAAHTFKRRKLRDYCAAIANIGGGKLLLGVTQQSNKTGVPTGTSVHQGTYNTLSHELLRDLGITVDVEEFLYKDKRLIIFHIPSHPIGDVVRAKHGNYNVPMRVGESLCEMDRDTMRNILNENESDYSAEIIPGLSIGDLDPDAINVFKGLWAQRSKRPEYASYSDVKTLDAIGAMVNGDITVAALLLFGKAQVIARNLPGAEIIFEWRNDEKQTRYDDRRSWREPFFLIYDDIWKTINSRNNKYPIQMGFIQEDVLSFNKKVIREALFNAVAHRDYRISSRSVFIYASPKSFIVESPGGFLPGITPENVIFKKQWRNRLIAETFEKADFVERSGQGVDDIFENTIREGKGLPNYNESDASSVHLYIPAAVSDPAFIGYLERIANERSLMFSFEEIFELERIREQQTDIDRDLLKRFKDLGIIESKGRGKSTRYLLSHNYYSAVGKSGIHTRLAGIPREREKELILEHLRRNGTAKAPDFRDIFPNYSRHVINRMLQELKKDGKIVVQGKTKGSLWRIS